MGVGCDVTICKHSGDMEALDALAKVEVGQHGGDRKTRDINLRIPKVDRGEEVTSGDTQGYVMRRLAKDAPAIHAQERGAKNGHFWTLRQCNKCKK